MAAGAFLTAALALAEHGVPVFPVWPPDGAGCSCVRGAGCDRAAKHPVAFLAPNGLKSASTDLEAVRRWWARAEWRTGRPWNLGAAVPPWAVVVDLDGPGALEVVRAEGLALPATLTAETGRPGGLHLWYRTDRPIAPAVAVLPHVDIRGPGSYVVAPPSLHHTGRRYRWRGTSDVVPDWQEMAEAPAWLYEHAMPATSASRTTTGGWAELLSGPVAEGARNTTAARLAGLLFRRLPADVAWPLLRAWNAAACRPPLDNDELGRVAESIAARELRRRGGAA